jgi:uncharacterized protein
MPTISEARAWYAQADPVHDFDHVLRVLHMAERIGRAEGADLEIIRAAALLHDAQGAAPGEREPGGQPQDQSGRASHHESSADFAAQILEREGWPPERIAAVQHCIRAHRFRYTSERPQTKEAQVIFDADKLDVLGAIGAARTIAYAVLDGQPVYAEPSKHFLSSGEKEPGEPHSSYHEFIFKLSKIKDRLYTPTARVIAEGRYAYLVGFYEQLKAEFAGLR